MLTAISDGMVALLKEFYGRGPDREQEIIERRDGQDLLEVHAQPGTRERAGVPVARQRHSERDSDELAGRRVGIVAAGRVVTV
ncbi:MAG: hypothetical protein WKF96_25655 [Solirubrobacteraceae bacterium]